MDFLNTIKKPWQHPIEYFELVLYLVIFVIVTFIALDGMRVLGDFVKQAAE